MSQSIKTKGETTTMISPTNTAQAATSTRKEYTERDLVVKLLTHLHRGGQCSYWWTLEDKRSEWWAVGKMTKCPQGKVNTYFGVNPTSRKGNSKQRSTIETIAAINCLIAEFDAKDFESDKAKALEHIRGLTLAPSVLVDSGGGYHCYWLLRESFIISSPADRKRAKDLQAHWVTFTGGDKAAKDLARVLRVPGTKNFKYDPPRAVRILEPNFDRLYTLDELERVMQSASTPQAAAQPLTKQKDTQHKKKYALAALTNELAALRSSQNGTRNDQLNRSSFALGQLIRDGGLDRFEVESQLTRVALELGLTEAETRATIKSGIEDGMSNPRNAPDPARPSSVPSGAEGEGDPIMALVESAAQMQDRNAALRSVFAKIAQCDPIDIITKYKQRVTDSFNLTAKDFERILSSHRASLAEVIDGQLCWNRDPLCNFNASITHELLQQDGQYAARLLYTIEGNLPTGETLRPLTIPAENFSELKWITQWGTRAIVRVRPRDRWLIPNAMQELSQPKRETVYTFTGWEIINGQRVFLSASGAITPEGLDTSVRVDLGEGQMQKYALPEPPSDPREAMLASLAFLELAPLTVTVPLWAAMYAAPLTSHYPLNACMWVYGKTQSRKSTITALALTHYGEGFINGRDPKLPRDWESTPTDLEGAMFATKDLPLVIDDYTPQQTRGDSDSQRNKAQRAIKSIGNRSYRGRSDVHLKERSPRPPRGLVISTAEEPITGQAVNGRMIYVQVNTMDVKTGSLLDTAQEKAGKGIYAKAMAAYLQWLAFDENKKITQAINYDHDTALREGNEKLPSSQSRLISYYAALYTGARNGLRFALEVDAIHREEFDVYSKKIAGALFELLIKQSERVASQSPIIRLCEALADVMTQGNALILQRLKQKSDVPDRMTLLGWYHESEPTLYLQTNICIQVARDYYNRLGQNFDVSPESFRRDMANSGLLTTKDDKQYEINNVFMGAGFGSPRVLAIKAESIETLTGVILYPPKREKEKS